MMGAIRREVWLTPNRDVEPDLEQLLLHLTCLSIGILIAAAIIFGIYRYPVHALMPLFLVTSIWFTAQARKAVQSPEQIRRFIVMALSVAIFALFARAANMYVLQPVCSICRWGIPYAELAAEMKQRGMERKRILVNDRELGGNLRRFFPESIIALAGSRSYVPPQFKTEKPDKSKIAIVWSADLPLEKAASQFQKILPAIAIEDLKSAETISIPWKGFFWVPYGHPVSSWRLVFLDDQ